MCSTAAPASLVAQRPYNSALAAFHHTPSGVVTAPANAKYHRIWKCWVGGTRFTARTARRQVSPADISGLTRCDTGTGTTTDGTPYCMLAQWGTSGIDTAANRSSSAKAVVAATSAREGRLRAGSLRSFTTVTAASTATAGARNNCRTLSPVSATWSSLTTAEAKTSRQVHMITDTRLQRSSRRRASEAREGLRTECSTPSF